MPQRGEIPTNVELIASNGAAGDLFGYSVGINESANTIVVGAPGLAFASNTTQGAAYVFVEPASGDGVPVYVGSAGQLGTISSSRRYKYLISDMGAESDLLMKLRPVSFYYNMDLHKSQTRQHGLVAEEVAKVAPGLVVFGKDGQPETVRYHFVNAMLLNQVQKQQRTLDEDRRLLKDQQRTNDEQKRIIPRQQAEIESLAARLAKLEALVASKP